VNARQAEPRNESGGILGHRLEAVRRGDRSRQGCQEVGRPELVEVRRQARVAVVVAHHFEARVHELPAEVVVPARQLGAQPHDEQDRGIAPAAQPLVLDPDRRGLTVWSERGKAWLRRFPQYAFEHDIDQLVRESEIERTPDEEQPEEHRADQHVEHQVGIRIRRDLSASRRAHEHLAAL